jgi:NAD(P)H dehydrogenase (quinone)
MAQSDGDASPDLAPPASDLATAEALGRRVAQAARDYNAGRRATATAA